MRRRGGYVPKGAGGGDHNGLERTKFSHHWKVEEVERRYLALRQGTLCYPFVRPDILSQT